MPDTMTTANKFPVYDITHTPKRTQAGNLKVLSNDESNSLNNAQSDSGVPSIVTLERAINFYETHAEGEYKNLYLQTAKWLREFMSRSISIPTENSEV